MSKTNDGDRDDDSVTTKTLVLAALIAVGMIIGGVVAITWIITTAFTC